MGSPPDPDRDVAPEPPVDAAEIERLRRLTEKLLRRRGNLQSFGDDGVRMDEAAVAREVGEALEKVQAARGQDDGPDPHQVAAAASKVASAGFEKPSRDLRAEEAASYQLIIETLGRPALAVTRDGVEPPVDTASNERWIAYLSLRGAAVLDATRAVGAVFRQVGGGAAELIGTAWRASNGRFVTNRHVAARLAENRTSRAEEWSLAAGARAWIDFSFFGEPSPELVPLTRIVYACSEPMIDLAVLESGAAVAGDALEIDWRSPIQTGNEIYVVGHPQSSSLAPEVASIFPDADGRKRLSPGEVDRVRSGDMLFEHDCSTLGGNSGSCAVDFATGRVRGLHFGGKGADAAQVTGTANLCVGFALLGNHPLAKLLKEGRAGG